MDESSRMQSIDRRLFLGAGASTLLAMPALAQQGVTPTKPAEAKPETKPAAPTGDTKRLSQVIADFVTGFDLKTVPPVVIDRARVAITDTVGVMLAGSRQEVSHILCDMVRLELLYSAQNESEFRALRNDLEALLDCPIGKEQWERALEVYEELARRGALHHRAVKHPDLLIAAAAEAAGVAVLHYDEDYDRIAAITGQEVRWIAQRGSLG